VAARLDRDSGAPVEPSMSLSVQRKAVEIAVAATLAGGAKTRRSKA